MPWKKIVEIEVPYGKKGLKFNVLREQLVDIMVQNDVPAVKDEVKEIKRALINPIGSKMVGKIVKPGETTVLIVSDRTRPTPNKMAPYLLEELATAGVKKDDITIIFGLGTHKPQTSEEKEAVLGKELLQSYNVIEHDSKDSKKLMILGRTSRGTNIEINKSVVEADRVITTGFIEPTYLAGFSGGRKSIMPGVSAYESIEQNHSLLLSPQTRLGVVKGNPMSDDMLECARKVGVDCIVNSVLDSSNELVRVVAGDLIKAWETGVDACKEVYEVNTSKAPDIVIASPGGYPFDIDLTQAKKAVVPAGNIVKERGSIILVAECKEAYGSEEKFRVFMKNYPTPEDIFEAINEKFVFGGHSAYLLARVMKEKNADIFLVSEMNREVDGTVLKPADTIEDAIRLASEKVKGRPKISVIPDGRRLIPITRIDGATVRRRARAPCKNL